VESTKELKLNNDEQKQAEKLKKADIIFTSDHHAKIKLLFTGFNVSDGYWYYNKDADVIVITEWDNQKEDRMRFWYDELDNGDLKLYMDETPYAITVTRKVEK
jgi:hypothetical protein